MNEYGSLSDVQLSGLLKSGDHAAFAEIYERYWDFLYGHALKMLRDEAEAQDLVQDLFISLWSKAAQMELNTNLPGYLYISVRHKVLNVIRKRKHDDKFIDLLSSFIERNNDHILEQIDEKELMAGIEKEIRNLPSKMKQVFEYSRKEHLSHKEIATQLGISDKTVKKQIGNAIKIIRLRLNIPAGLVLAIAVFLGLK
jgi:RNA polymerase sigma-70 factor (family 1)